MYLDAGDFTLVYDIPTQTWMAWSLQIAGAFPAIPGGGVSRFPEVVIAETVAQRLGQTRSGQLDNGVDITARYRTGFWTPTVGTVRASDQSRGIYGWILDGTGSVTVTNYDSDSVSTTDPGSPVTLGTAPAVARGYCRRGAFGTNFGLGISGTGPWSVSRVIAEVP